MNVFTMIVFEYTAHTFDHIINPSVFVIIDSLESPKKLKVFCIREVANKVPDFGAIRTWLLD